MPLALFLSPHLDDVAFSCGGTFATLARAGWQCVLLTVFTRSVPSPTGFALACQTDKGLDASVDYLALRRAEDTAAARQLGASAVRWLDLPEAPHRGYHSPAALFAGVLPTDNAARELTPLLAAAVAELAPQLLFAPQGFGQHADHRVVMQAVRAAAPPALPLLWYRDTPYIIRQPDAAPAPELPVGLIGAAVPLAATALAAKISASQAYGSQIPFQFGGSEQVALKLEQLAVAEGQVAGIGQAAERFTVAPGHVSWLPTAFKVSLPKVG